MNRRGFFQRTIGAITAAWLAPRQAPALSLTGREVNRRQIAFHPNAFSFVMADLRKPQLEVNRLHSARMDVIYGWSRLRDVACRIEGSHSNHAS